MTLLLIISRAESLRDRDGYFRARLQDHTISTVSSFWVSSLTIRLRTIALACSCLFTAAVSSFAQTNNDATAASPEDTATAPSSNAAAASLQRVLARAIMAAFSPLGSMAGTEPTYLEDVAFSTDQAQGTPSQGQAKPPASNPAAPSLPDLGFPPDQTQGNALDQARLDKRSHMLKIHQRLGLITTVPLLATVLSGSFAGGKATSSSGRDLHAGLGGLTTGLYFATAYYSIFAPKVPGTQARGPIRLHKALAWIHGPGMILTPILGVMAFDQKSRGERVHGIASAHGAVGYVTAAAYGLAILSVSIKF
jgi:hypothetical protein